MIEFRVTGVVQGVSFRYSAVETAKNLALRGWVRNCEDGKSVEGQASGDASNLDKFQQWLRKGPSGAKVDDLQCETKDDSSSSLPYPFEARH